MILIMETQKYRDSLIDRAAQAFSRDRLEEAEFEAFVVRVQAAPGVAELRAAEASIAHLLPAVAEVSELEDERAFSLNMGNLRRRGDWVDARGYRLEGKMSNFELDYRAYEDVPDFTMILDIDLSMSNLKLLVPPDWRVEDRISNSTGSNFLDRGRAEVCRSCRIVIRGSLSMSNVIVRRRSRRGGLLALLFGR